MHSSLITSIFAVHGRHGVVTERFRSWIEYLVAVSGHMASKSPLKICWCNNSYVNNQYLVKSW